MDRNEERIQSVLTEKTQRPELVAEISLPDYRSEISRLLWVRPVLLPPTRFIGGGKADLSGTVHYHILYVGPDGGLYGAVSEEEYTFSVPLELADGQDARGIELSVQVCPDAVVSRVTGPRKLSVRCRVQARVQGTIEDTAEPLMHGVAEGVAPYRLNGAVRCGCLSASDVTYFDLSDSAELGGGEGETRVICASGRVFLPEVSGDAGFVRCRGEAVIRLLVCREPSGEEAPMPEVITRRIPFEREIAMPDATADHRVCVLGDVGEIRTTVEDGRVDLEADLVLCAEAAGERTAVVCRDAFLTEHRAECRMGEARLWRSGAFGNRNFSISGELPAAEAGLPADAELILTEADAEIRERENDGTRTALSGQLVCHTLFCREGEYGVAETVYPFRVQLEGGSDEALIGTAVPVCRVRRAGDAVRVDAELLLAVRGRCHLPVAMLAEATFTPAQPIPRADVEICYPGPGEGVWEVSKRYGVSPTELATANGLPAESIGDASAAGTVRFLRIP